MKIIYYNDDGAQMQEWTQDEIPRKDDAVKMNNAIYDITSIIWDYDEAVIHIYLKTAVGG